MIIGDIQDLKKCLSNKDQRVHTNCFSDLCNSCLVPVHVETPFLSARLIAYQMFFKNLWTQVSDRWWWWWWTTYLRRNVNLSKWHQNILSEKKVKSSTKISPGLDHHILYPFRPKQLLRYYYKHYHCHHDLLHQHHHHNHQNYDNQIWKAQLSPSRQLQPSLLSFSLILHFIPPPYQ